jgi:hypothetical protein
LTFDEFIAMTKKIINDYWFSWFIYRIKLHISIL